MVINGKAVKTEKTGRTLKFGFCPRCGRKGLYRVRQRYSRCRYCGLYRIARPGQDF
ncbi:MAG TPA: hypothetical protein VJ377_08525 [Dehalococcoidales bacterium]|nr:hypothetical protein [Dehalococcoidales bacterium]